MTSRRMLPVLVALTLSSSLYGLDPFSLNPFKSLPWTEIGNVPLSPNPSFELGNLLHLMAVDLYQSTGTAVFAVHSGIPSLPNERRSREHPWVTTVQITRADGLMSYYMHLDPDTISPQLLQQVAAHSEVAAGAFLGRLIAPPASLRSHVHFGMADCRRKVRLNPLRYLAIHDTQPPVIEAISAVPTEETPTAPASDRLSGAVALTASVYDTIDGSLRIYPPNRIELELSPELDTGTASEASFKSVIFDGSEMPAGELAADEQCSDFDSYDSYEPELGERLYRFRKAGSGKGFLIALTSRGLDVPEPWKNWYRPYTGAWVTDACDANGEPRYPDGFYTIRVRALDAAGNEAQKEHRFEVRNSSCHPDSHPVR